MMRRLVKKSGQRGAAAIEFAIILPLLVLLIFGMIEFSVLFYDKAMITNASREGARAGIVFSTLGPLSDDQVHQVVANYCSDHLVSFQPGSVVSTTVTRTGTSSGDRLTVRVEYPYNFLILPNLVTGLTGPLNLSAETIMRME